MIKTLKKIMRQDREGFCLPKGVQDIIPVKKIYEDGIFQIGKNKFSKMYRFDDINYYVASKEDKEAMFLEYSELLNALDSSATTKLTINNRSLNRADFENKMEPKVVQKLMGHSSISVTLNIYTHVLNNIMDEEIKKFGVANTSDEPNYAELGIAVPKITAMSHC